MSLLLDALKKAAQEKLEKKSPGSQAEDATELESPPAQTQLEAETEMSVDSTEAEATETKLEKFDLRSEKQIEHNTESATEIDKSALALTEIEGMETEVSSHTLTHVEKSSSASTPAQPTSGSYDSTSRLNTEIETPSTTAEITPKAETELELAPLEHETLSEEDLNFEIESTTQYNRDRANALASELQEFLNPDNTQSTSATASDHTHKDTSDLNLATDTDIEDVTQFGPSEDVSLTQNWSEQQSNYVASPQHAQKLFANKAFGNNQRKRMLALLALMLIAFVFIAGIYSYSYVTTLNENSVVINRPARPSQTIPTGQQTIAPNDKVIDPALLIEQEDYSAILQDNLSDSREKPVSNPKPSSASRRSTPPRRQPLGGTQKAVATQQGELSIRKTQPTERLEDIIMQGYTNYKNGNLEASKTAYQKAFRLSATNRDTLLGLAAIAIAEDNTAQAHQYYRQLFDINPKDDLAIAGLTATGDANTRAISDDEESRIKLLLKEMPNSPQLHFTLGNFFAHKKRWPDAQRAYFDAFRLQADNPDYAFNLAVSLDHLSQISTARRFYREALKLAKTQQANFDNEAVTARITALQTE